MQLQPLFCTVAAWLGVLLFTHAAEPIALRAGKNTLLLSSTNGAILEVRVEGANRPLLRSVSNELWRARFEDGSVVTSAQFSPQSGAASFHANATAAGATLSYKSAALELTMKVSAVGAETFEFTPSLKVHRGVVIDLAGPGRLRFDAADVQRFVSPVHPHLGVGAAFNSNFFGAQPQENATSWKTVSQGPGGYVRLFGSGLDMRDLKSPATRLRSTEAGKQWLGALAGRFDPLSVPVTRPPKRAQADVVLVDSADGPLFSGSHLGGLGWLWRWGGQLEAGDAALAGDAVATVIRHLAGAEPIRRKLGFVNLQSGPEAGSWANLSVAKWQEKLQQVARASRLELVEFKSAAAMQAALAGDEFVAILNPYGEAVPVPAGSTLTSVVDAIGRYVRQGGNWFECGGYSFYVALTPGLYLKYEHTYPPVFSDFVHLGSKQGSASIYRVQPRDWQPWSGTNNREHIFVPGRLAFGGSEQGGWFDRTFTTYVKAGDTWTAPVVRVVLGRTAEQDIEAYEVANAIHRKLRDKMSPQLLDTFRRAVLVKYDGNASNLLAHLHQLPVPSLIHYSDYLKGGFDKEYPDHLPPRPGFGTPAELRALHDRSHQLGHLIMPYTNPTWWCDHPRGPTFERAGEARLQVNLNGSRSHEVYGKNDGWTITMWHPAVRAANDKTLQQFTTEYPTDIVFQDQCGARDAKLDLNPASPTPLAYVEGMLSLVDEQSRLKPLGTEDGWDRVLNAEAQLCGFTFALGPGRRVTWSREMKSVYAPETWQLYPFVQRLAQDKAALLHHDLGKFVTDRPTLAWTLGLGFAMSYRIQATALDDPARREWLRWLDRIQQSICARYIGEPLQTFEHRQGTAATGDDGLIHATYGPMELWANLSPKTDRLNGPELQAYGFVARAPGLFATDAGENAPSVIVETRAEGAADVWIYAPAAREATFELPRGEYTVTFDKAVPAKLQVTGPAATVRVPAGTDTVKRLWHATVKR